MPVKFVELPLKASNLPPRKFLLFSSNLGIFSFLFGFYKVMAGNCFGNFYTKLRIRRKSKNKYSSWYTNINMWALGGRDAVSRNEEFLRTGLLELPRYSGSSGWHRCGPYPPYRPRTLPPGCTRLPDGNPSQTEAPRGPTEVGMKICKLSRHFSRLNRNSPWPDCTDRDIKFLCSGLGLQQLSMVTPLISCWSEALTGSQRCD